MVKARIHVGTPWGNASADLEASGEGGFAFKALRVDDRAVAIARLWSHATWTEVAIHNGAIAGSPGPWVGDYSVEIDGGDTGKVDRSGAHFGFGTGFVEFFGTPEVSPLPRGMAYLGNWTGGIDWAFAESAILAANPLAPAQFPLTPSFWDGVLGTTLAVDVPNKHQTGSPTSKGDLGDLVGMLAVQHGELLAERWSVEAHRHARDRLVRALLAFMTYQARRPWHFLDPSTGQPFRASEWPKLRLGDFGPAGGYGATQWGAEAFAAPDGPHTGLELEHLNTKEIAGAAALLGSGVAAEQLTCVAEGVCTQPYAREITDSGCSCRTWGWSAAALADAIAILPDAARRLDYGRAASNLLAMYLREARVAPIPYFWAYWPVKKHLYPTLDEVGQWAALKGLPGVGGAASVDVALDELEQMHDGARNEVLGLFRFALTWQMAVCGFGARALAFATEGRDPRCRWVQQHVLFTLMQAGRNPSGTFFHEIACSIPGRHGNDDEGTQRDSLALWTAGCVGALSGLADEFQRPAVLAAVHAVSVANKYLDPGNVYGIFWKWWLGALGAGAIGTEKP